MLQLSLSFGWRLRERPGVAVLVDVTFAVGVIVGVPPSDVAVAVFAGVALGDISTVLVGVPLVEPVGVSVGVSVAPPVLVGVCVLVLTGVGVFVLVAVTVAVCVNGTTVLVAVARGVGVAVGVSVASAITTEPFIVVASMQAPLASPKHTFWSVTATVPTGTPAATRKLQVKILPSPRGG